MTIRIATADDLPRINEIYNHYVETSTCTYQEELETLADRRQWFESHLPAHPIIVAEIDGTIVGFGYMSAFRSRSAYRQTVENSVYVHHAYHRRGIGSALMKDLIARARALQHHVIIAAIDGEQAGSIAMHARLGFEKIGELKQVGRKFGRWLDVVYMQLTL
jgi:L-amino acid N-acyltransferase